LIELKSSGFNRRSLVALLGLGFISPFDRVTLAQQRTAFPFNALVIGNDLYQSSARLSNAANDAKLIAKALAPVKATIQIELNLSESKMAKVIASCSRKIESEGGVSWIYYAGHGVQIEGKNYLQGIDSDFSSPQQFIKHGIELDKLIQYVNLPSNWLRCPTIYRSLPELPLI
jgi:Caspase domain